MREAVWASNVDSLVAKNADPRHVIAEGWIHDDGRRSVANRARRRGRVIVCGRRSSVRLDHFGPRVRARSRNKEECKDR